MYYALRIGMWTEVCKPTRRAYLAQSEKFTKNYPLRSDNIMTKNALSLPLCSCTELTRQCRLQKTNKQTNKQTLTEQVKCNSYHSREIQTIVFTRKQSLAMRRNWL